MVEVIPHELCPSGLTTRPSPDQTFLATSVAASTGPSVSVIA
jgi:hypothetical protein